MKIYIADPDSISNLIVLRNLRSSTSHEIKIFYNSSELLTALNSSKPDLILIDRTLLTDVKLFEPWAPRLIVISTFINDKMREHWKSSGFKNMIIKPLTIKKLDTVLNREMSAN